MLEEFEDEVFGEYANKTSYEEFEQNLAQNGWKYFNL